MTVLAIWNRATASTLSCMIMNFLGIDGVDICLRTYGEQIEEGEPKESGNFREVFQLHILSWSIDEIKVCHPKFFSPLSL